MFESVQTSLKFGSAPFVKNALDLEMMYRTSCTLIDVLWSQPIKLIQVFLLQNFMYHFFRPLQFLQGLEASNIKILIQKLNSL